MAGKPANPIFFKLIMAYFSHKVIVAVSELPLPAREFKENMILLELWHSPKSPPVNMLLGNIVRNIKKFQTTGILLKLDGSKYLFSHLF